MWSSPWHLVAQKFWHSIWHNYILFWHFIWHSIWHINIYIHSDPLSAGANFEWFRMPVCRLFSWSQCQWIGRREVLQDPPHYIYISNIYIYVYFWWENQWFPVKIFPKKNNPLTMSGQPFNTGANTWDKRAVIPPCRTCACRSPRSAALLLVELGIRGIRPRMTVSFLLFDFEAYHVGSMLDHFKFCPLFGSSLDYPSKSISYVSKLFRGFARHSTGKNTL